MHKTLKAIEKDMEEKDGQLMTLQQENTQLKARLMHFQATLQLRNVEHSRQRKSLERCENQNIAMTNGLKQCEMKIKTVQDELTALLVR
jgi:chromosome segregation ATPase